MPTKALVTQTTREMERLLPGIPVGRFYGEIKQVVDFGVNITTYPSLYNHSLDGSLPDPIRSSALVFVDEAHHAMTPRRSDALRRRAVPKLGRLKYRIKSAA